MDGLETMTTLCSIVRRRSPHDPTRRAPPLVHHRRHRRGSGSFRTTTQKATMRFGLVGGYGDGAVDDVGNAAVGGKRSG